MHLDQTVGLSTTHLLDHGNSSPDDWASLTSQTALDAVEQALPVLTNVPYIADEYAPGSVPCDPVAGDRAGRGWNDWLQWGPSLADQYRDAVGLLRSVASSVDESAASADTAPPSDALHDSMDEHRSALVDVVPTDVGALVTVLEQQYDTSYSDLEIHSEQPSSAVLSACQWDNWACYYAALYPCLVRRAVATNYETLRKEATSAST
jgi:hypothetical protein